MEQNENIKKLPVRRIFDLSLEYVRDNRRNMLRFVLANFVLLVLGLEIIRPLSGFLPPMFTVAGVGVDVIGNVLFLLWSIGFYVFWCFFFRFYYNRRPYLLIRKIADSLIPSTKILVTLLVFATIISVLPYMPPFMGMPLEMADSYLQFLEDMQKMQLSDAFWTGFLTLIAPFLLYRPFMAWISAVIGRSGLIKTAMQKTRGNYWEFVLIIAMFNVTFAVLDKISFFLHLPHVVLWFLASPLIVFFNVVIAKSYDFFFLDTLDE